MSIEDKILLSLQSCNYEVSSDVIQYLSSLDVEWINDILINMYLYKRDIERLRTTIRYNKTHRLRCFSTCLECCAKYSLKELFIMLIEEYKCEMTLKDILNIKISSYYYEYCHCLVFLIFNMNLEKEDLNDEEIDEIYEILVEGDAPRFLIQKFSDMYEMKYNYSVSTKIKRKFQLIEDEV